MNKAVFIDRDGVINKWEHGQKDVPESWYILSWEQFEVLPGVIDAFRLIANTDYIPIIVSNQSGIGRGYADFKDINDIFDSFQTDILVGTGVFVSYYFCPHAPDAGCACRKPSPGMLYKAAIEHDIDLSKSWMVGDSWTDIWAGGAAGIPGCIKVGDYSEVEMVECAKMERENISCDVYFARNLEESVDLIMSFDRLDAIIAEEAEKHEN